MAGGTENQNAVGANRLKGPTAGSGVPQQKSGKEHTHILLELQQQLCFCQLCLLCVTWAVSHWANINCTEIKGRREKLTVVFYSELMQKDKNFTSTL